MRNSAGAILYIGKAVDLRKRVSNYFRPTGLDVKIRALMAEVKHIDYIAAGNEREALVIEQRLINRHQPAYNTMWRDDKSYPYVRISLNEDFPRIDLTRRKKNDGARYFGPFPDVRPIRRLLQWIWNRHIFPLRPCRLAFSENQWPPRSKVQSCIYLHTGKCPAPCVGRISRKDYRKIAERVVLFFEGGHARLEKTWRREMKAAAKARNFELAAHLRDNIRAVEQIRQRVTVRALRPEEVQSRIEATQALSELKNALALPRPPLRIEAFDISHSQGTATVASLVTFDRGKPAKAGYRKYIIKTVRGVDDFASMEEVVGRRYRRLMEEEAAMPDLILVDGGPGQLSAALKALEKAGVKKQPIAALAKQEEEIYRPGAPEPVRLPKDSPALQLLQHVRDESHRFAVGFHRQRRGKGMWGDGNRLPGRQSAGPAGNV